LVITNNETQAMQDGFCLSEWLIQEGYFTIKEYPSKITPLGKCNIDRAHTKIYCERRTL